MARVSVLIPSRSERFLPNTVADLLTNARGDIEVLPILDGYWPDPPLLDDPRVRPLHFDQPRGMRVGLNAAAGVATGEFLMKTDAHCLFAEGFDLTLAADCDGDWLVIPRRKRLDGANWCVADPQRAPIDYHYLDCPLTNPAGFQMHGVVWAERGRERLHLPIDETMSFQGSCWFTRRSHWQRLGGLEEDHYGMWAQEPQSLGNKTWLSGGRVMVNKQTYYAHLHKGRAWGRGYSMSGLENTAGHNYGGHYWMEDRWEGRVRNFEWLVDHFWPVPTWPDDWKERWQKLRS